MMRVLRITNIPIFFLVRTSIYFLSIEENKRKFKKIEKRKTYFVHMLFRKSFNNFKYIDNFSFL